MKRISLKDFSIGGDGPFVVIAGPCVIETEETTVRIAGMLKETAFRMGIPMIFKASYD